MTTQLEGTIGNPSEAPTCITCSELVVSSPEGCRCQHGRFDKRNPRWFAMTGITRPNKTGKHKGIARATVVLLRLCSTCGATQINRETVDVNRKIES